MMRKNTSSGTGEHLGEFGRTQAKGRRRSSASDAVRPERDCSKLQERKLATLRVALIAGERSGPCRPFDFEAFIARKRVSRSPI
jgi:antitoxin ParD1/3/4